METTTDNLSSAQVNSLPKLQYIEFTDADVQANALGILTENQRENLYQRWYKMKGGHIYTMIIAFPIISAFVDGIFKLYFVFTILLLIVFIGLGFWLIKFINRKLKDHILRDTKIISFTGTAQPYEDDSGWYLKFDDKVIFKIEDQPNKLFHTGQRYRVFMTDKDKIIISARKADTA